MENQQQVVEYASVNRRLIAACVDMLIIFLVFSPILGFIDNLIYNGRPPYVIIQDIISKYGNADSTIDAGIIFKKFSEEKIWQKTLFLHSIALLILAIYTLVFWRKLGATPGKYLLCCTIVDRADLQRPTLARFIIRVLGYFVSFIPLGLGFIMMSFTREKQGLHDKMAGTIVIVMKPDFSWLKKVGISNIKKKNKSISTGVEFEEG